MLQSYIQQSLFPELDEIHSSVQQRHSRSGTFIDNMKLPIHRWFRYSAGFSAEWVEQEILAYESKDAPINVLDPFAGSATTLLAAESIKTKAVGFEPHPFVHRVAKAKLEWNVDTNQLREIYREIVRKAGEGITESKRFDVPLLKKCFTKDSLSKLDSLKDIYLSEFDNGNTVNEIIWLGITSIIRACSTAGTAPWQYVLPNKKK